MSWKSSIRNLLVLALVVPGGSVVSGTSALAGSSGSTARAGSVRPAAVETRHFTGYGDSSFGFALEYARADARRQANAAGFYNCTEIFLWDPSPYSAMVIWECTR